MAPGTRRINPMRLAACLLIPLCLLGRRLEAHHFTSTVTGQVVYHLPSAKVVTPDHVVVYFDVLDQLLAGERLKVWWTPPAGSPCVASTFFYPFTLAGKRWAYRTWRDGGMECAGLWTAEIVIERPTGDQLLIRRTINTREPSRGFEEAFP